MHADVSPVWPTYSGGYAIRTSPRAGHRAGPPRVRSKQAGTVAEGANEKVQLASRKGPRSAESTSEFQSCDDTILGILHLFLMLVLTLLRLD